MSSNSEEEVSLWPFWALSLMWSTGGDKQFFITIRSPSNVSCSIFRLITMMAIIPMYCDNLKWFLNSKKKTTPTYICNYWNMKSVNRTFVHQPNQSAVTSQENVLERWDIYHPPWVQQRRRFRLVFSCVQKLKIYKIRFQFGKKR